MPFQDATKGFLQGAFFLRILKSAPRLSDKETSFIQ